jgi:hypothetical protein
MADIRALAGLDVCSPSEETKCREEIGSDEFWRGACKICEKKKSIDIHPYVFHLAEIRLLQRGGYRFKRNDLSYQMWVDLGVLKEALDHG